MLRDKAFNIGKNTKHDGYQCGFASMVHNFFDKKTSGGEIKKEIIQNQQLAEELHKFALADMQLISKFNIRFLFCCAVDIYSICTLIIPWKNIKGIKITNTFQKILNKSNCKRKKLWVSKESES